MTTETVELFYAILALLAVAAMAALAVLRMTAFASEAAADRFDAIAERLRPSALWMAFVVALLATIGSLYFSEVAHFEPCRLCWYQRIAMYPLVVILGIGAVRRDTGVRLYGMALAAIGAALSAYHVAVEWIPALDTGTCGLGPSCSVVWFRVFGFVSLPTLALIAFLSILTLLAIVSVDSDDDEATDAAADERSLP